MKNLKVTVVEMKKLVERVGKYVNKENKVTLAFGIPGTVTTETMQCIARISTVGATAEAVFEATAEEQQLDAQEPLLMVHVQADTFCKRASALIPYDTDITLEVVSNSLVLKAGDNATLPVPTVGSEEVEEPVSDDTSCVLARAAVSPTEFNKVAKKGCSMAANDDLSSPCGYVYLTFKENNFYGFSVGAGTAVMSRAEGICKAKFVPENIAGKYLQEYQETVDATKAKELQGKIQEKVEKNESVADLAKETGLQDMDSVGLSMLPNTFSLLKAVFADALKNGVNAVKVILTPTVLRVQAGTYSTWLVLSNYKPSAVEKFFDKFGALDWCYRSLMDKEQFARSISLHALSGDDFFKLSPKENTMDSSWGGTNTSTVLIDRDGDVPAQDNLHLRSDMSIKAISAIDNGNIVISFTSDTVYGDKMLRISNGALDGSESDCVTYLALCNPPEQSEEEDAVENTEEV